MMFLRGDPRVMEALEIKSVRGPITQEVGS